MIRYLFRRLLLVPPTLFAIMAINFVVIQAAPGGPIEQIAAAMQNHGGVLQRVGGEEQHDVATREEATRATRGLDPLLVEELRRELGFDKPLHVRFLETMWRYATFDFGRSFFRDRPVVDLIVERLPVSMSLGLWTTLLTYLVSIPLGIRKAVRDGSRFDVWTSTVVIVGNAVPGFLFAILLIVLFAGGSYFRIFPLRGLVSDNWYDLPWYGRILDYLWHITLPVISMSIGSFAGLTLLTKNSFLEEIDKQYVMTARAKGLGERRVLYGHVFRNAMLIVVAGFPAAFVGAFFTGSLLIETIFSLDGLGLLGFEAAVARDYPVVFATLYMFTLIGLLIGVVSDVVYTIVDPRIDFDGRTV